MNLNTYYIVFESKGGRTLSWRILKTDLDLDKISDLHKFITEWESEVADFFLHSWKLLHD